MAVCTVEAQTWIGETVTYDRGMGIRKASKNT